MKTNKKKKKTKLIYKLIVGLLIIISILFILGLMKLNILSLKWFMLVLGILLVIDFLLWLFIIKSKKKKTSSFLAFIFMLILSLSSFYLFKTSNLFSGMFMHYKTYNYSIVVSKNSSYKKIEDLNNKNLGYFTNTEEEIKQAKKHIDSLVSLQYKEYTDTNQIVASLTNEEVDSILIEDSYLNMIYEENTTFKDQSQVIYKFKIKIKIEDFSRDVNVTEEPFNIYISGIDTYGTVSSVSRSDVNMVVTINPKTKQILMTSVPRDYYVTLHGITGYKDKMTHAGLYGIDMSVKTLEDLLGIDINYYFKVNFTSVIKMVDSLSGVSVYSDYTFTSIDGYNFSKGYNKVNGEEALAFVRERKAFATGDNQRILNQQALIQAMIKKCLSKEIIYKYNKLLNSLEGSFATNMAMERITALIRMQLDDMASWTITSNSLKGTDSSNYTYSYPSGKLYVMEPIADSINETINLIEAVFEGEVLENSFAENTSTSHTVTKSSSESNKKNNVPSTQEDTTTTSPPKVAEDDKEDTNIITSAPKEDNIKEDEDTSPTIDNSSVIESELPKEEENIEKDEEEKKAD